MLKLNMTGKSFSPGILKLLHIRFVTNGFKLWYNYVNVNLIWGYIIIFMYTWSIKKVNYMVKVLLIEDDVNARLVTKLHLRNEYNVLEASNGIEALDILEYSKVNLIIADVMMPQMDGYEFVKQFRLVDKVTPILLLTAKNGLQDKKEGFALEIDDYMTKPVHYEELLWRVRALLRRAQINFEKKIIIGELEIDESSNSLRRGKESVTLPKKEFELLYMLLSYPNKVFTTSELLDEIWGYETDSDETTVRTHINRLRKRFDDYSEFKLVTIRGLGYRGEINKQ